MHKRTMPYEIEGHEFFSYDGKWVWYDLQTPRSKRVLAGGREHRDRRAASLPESPASNWSVHYNISRDGKLFAGDGGGPGSVANQTPLPQAQRLDPPGNGQWIYLFTPTDEPTDDDSGRRRGGQDRRSSTSEKLVDLSKHNYQPRAERDDHARQQVGRVPLEHARGDACVCGGADRAEKVVALLHSATSDRK